MTPLFKYLIPIFLIVVPYTLRREISLSFDRKDLAFGVGISAVVLSPLSLLLVLTGREFTMPSLYAAVFELFVVAFPEEIFFRGFLQECIGNTVRGLVVTSALFGLLHVPQYLFYGDTNALLTFLPSLVMGFLYLKTSNILPSTVFHMASNIVVMGFYDIL